MQGSLRGPQADASHARWQSDIGYSCLIPRGSVTPMPTNIEIKARLADLPKTTALVVPLSDTPPQTLRQRDTFFWCAHGRLNLREMGRRQAELIS